MQELHLDRVRYSEVSIYKHFQMFNSGIDGGSQIYRLIMLIFNTTPVSYQLTTSIITTVRYFPASLNLELISIFV